MPLLLRICRISLESALHVFNWWFGEGAEAGTKILKQCVTSELLAASGIFESTNTGI